MNTPRDNCAATKICVITSTAENIEINDVLENILILVKYIKKDHKNKGLFGNIGLIFINLELDLVAVIDTIQNSMRKSFSAHSLTKPP